MALDSQIRSETAAPCAIDFTAKPFASRRWSNSCRPYHGLARNTLITNDHTFSIDRLNCFLQPHIYAQLQQTKSCRFRETFRERSKGTLSHVNQNNVCGLWVDSTEVLL